MKATELRLGNLIFCKVPSIGKSNQEKAAVVDLLEDETIGVTGSNFSASSPNPKHFEGIVLTEEWLLRFGFEKYGVPLLPTFQKSISWNDKTLKHISVCPEIGNQYIYLREGELDQKRQEDDIVCIFNGDVHGKLHVHQLQNLFHALTGKELELKQQPTPCHKQN